MYSKFPIDPKGLRWIGGWRMFVLGETTLIFIFSSEAVSVSESENGHDAFFRTVEDAAMPVWERLFWHSSQCGWDGFGDAGLPRKQKRDFF